MCVFPTPLTNRFSVKGGRANENFNNCNAAHVRHLRWRADVLDPDNSEYCAVVKVSVQCRWLLATGLECAVVCLSFLLHVVVPHLPFPISVALYLVPLCIAIFAQVEFSCWGTCYTPAWRRRSSTKTATAW